MERDQTGPVSHQRKIYKIEDRGHTHTEEEKGGA